MCERTDSMVMLIIRKGLKRISDNRREEGSLCAMEKAQSLGFFYRKAEKGSVLLGVSLLREGGAKLFGDVQIVIGTI
jgi:hypothetical protein